MKRILKYAVEPFKWNLIPHTARIIHCGVQKGNQVRVWAEVGDHDGKFHQLFIVETGGNVPEYPTVHVGTVQFTEEETELVFHIYRSNLLRNADGNARGDL